MTSSPRPRDEHVDELREFEVATTPDSELLRMYFDREAGALELGELLQRVANSSAAWREIAETQDLINELSAPIVSPDLTEQILARLEADPRSPLRRYRLLRPLRRIGGIAAALLLGLSLLLVGRFVGEPHSAPSPSLSRVLEAPREDAQLIRSLGESLGGLRERLAVPELRLEQEDNVMFLPVIHSPEIREPGGGENPTILLPERRLQSLQPTSRQLRPQPPRSDRGPAPPPDAAHVCLHFI
jgi:hypothetical protein